MDTITHLREELKRNIYGKEEADLNAMSRGSSTISTPDHFIQEPDTILTDLSYNYTLSSPIENILINRNRLVRMWRDVTFYPEVDEAINEIVDEALVFEETGEPPIEIDLEGMIITDPLKDKIRKSFNKILRMLDFDVKGGELFQQWYVDGTLNIEAVYNNNNIKEGIKKLVLLPPFDFYKVKLINTQEEIYFFNPRLNEYYAKSLSLPTIHELSKNANIKYRPEQITQIMSGVYSADKLFSISHLNKAMKVINQVSLIEDAIVIVRITRAPEKKVFYIDTGRLPKAKAEAYIQQLMNKHRNKMTYNFDTGSVENRKKSVSILEDYWLPRSADGKGTSIETIGGSSDGMLDKIEDLEWFYHKLYRALNVPANRREKESPFTAVTANNLDVEREEIKFFKFVVKLRKRFNLLFLDLLKKDLLATKTFTLTDWNYAAPQIKFKYKNNNDYAEAKKLANIATKFDIAGNALNLVESKLISKEWIAKNILNFTDEDIIKIAAEIEASAGDTSDDDGGF